MSAQCGTAAGYTGHRKKGEPACDPCKAANAAYKREYLARKPEVRARQDAYTAAHKRALIRLSYIYPDLFEALLAEERAR